MSYRSLIEEHKEEIDCFSQTGFPWRGGYKESFLKMVTDENADFETAINELPDELDRVTVRSFFFTEKDFYKGFVASMLWGGINATRCAKGHKGDLKTTDAYKAFTHQKKEVVKKLRSVKMYLDNRRIDKAFSSMADPKENHIPGIGVSFFTKLLYFMSPQGIIPRPLIYDRWSAYIHCALLIDEPKVNALDFYKGVNQDGTLSSVKDQIDLYMDYLDIMKRTAEANEIEDVSKLEAYLFGFARNRRGHKEEKQRRTFVEKYVLNFFAKKTSASSNAALVRTKKVAKQNPKDKLLKATQLPHGATIRKRQTLFGYNIPFEGRNYYLFVGEGASFRYLELLTGKGTERIEDCSLYHELKRDYLSDKDGKDYIYKLLKPYDEGEAKRLLDIVLKKMTNGNKEVSD